jgi:flagellum-specific peptidoglycan hydrolase FlgJ
MKTKTKIKACYTSLAVASALLTIQVTQTAHADAVTAKSAATPTTTSVSPSSSSATSTTSTTSNVSTSQSDTATTTPASASTYSTQAAQPASSSTYTLTPTEVTFSPATYPDTSSTTSTNPTSTQTSSSTASTTPAASSTTSSTLAQTSSTQSASTQAAATPAASATPTTESTTASAESYTAPSYSSSNAYVSNGSFQENFLQEIQPYAMNEWKQFKILPSLVAAQACVESYYGTEVSGSYNYFGIKGAGTDVPTEEWDGSEYVETSAEFSDYNSMANAFLRYGEFMTDGSRYDNVIGNTNWYSAAEDVAADGWATSPTYAQALIAVIEEYGLNSWDQEAMNEYDYPQAPQDTATVTIVYVPGYGVNGYDSYGYYVNNSRYVLKTGTAWKTFGSVVIDGQEMYAIAPDEYVPAKYTNAYDNDVVTVNYISGYGVNAYHSDGSEVANSSSTFKTGTGWVVDGVANIDGTIMYAVGPNEYLPKSSTQYGGIITINTTSNSGVPAYDSNGNQVANSNWTFLNGTSWKTDRVEIINGVVMYRVSTDEYIPQGYTQYYSG